MPHGAAFLLEEAGVKCHFFQVSAAWGDAEVAQLVTVDFDAPGVRLIPSVPFLYARL